MRRVAPLFLSEQYRVSTVFLLFLTLLLFSPLSLVKAEPVELNISGSQSIELTTTKAVYVTLPQDARDVLVADPTVTEIVIKTPRTAYLIGLKAGDTNAFFLDAAGNRILTLDIRVEKDLTALRKSIRELVPSSDVSVRATNGDIILSGEVTSSEMAENIRLLARRFVDNDDGIVNLLSVTRPEQVLIQVRVTEMRRAVAKKLGVSLLGRSTDFNFNTGVQSATDSLFDDRFASAIISGNIAGFANFESLIEALEDDGYIKTLAEPNLTALSGQEANFLAGGEFPIPVARNSDGEITLEFKPFGVGLRFTPVVLDSGRINLKIATEVSALSNDGAIDMQGLRIPALTVRRAETTVEIPSGGSLVLGGLLRNDAATQVNGVPGLSNVPILGSLFRSTDFQREETELVVIAIPYVVKATKPAELTTPVDGFVVTGDIEHFFLGRLYERYPGAEFLKTMPADSLGFIMD